MDFGEKHCEFQFEQRRTMRHECMHQPLHRPGARGHRVDAPDMVGALGAAITAQRGTTIWDDNA